MKKLSEKEAWLVLAGVHLLHGGEDDGEVRRRNGLCSAVRALYYQDLIDYKTYSQIGDKLEKAVSDARAAGTGWQTSWLAPRDTAGAFLRRTLAINASRRTRR